MEKGLVPTRYARETSVARTWSAESATKPSDASILATASSARRSNPSLSDTPSKLDSLSSRAAKTPHSAAAVTAGSQYDDSHASQTARSGVATSRNASIDCDVEVLN